MSLGRCTSCLRSFREKPSYVTKAGRRAGSCSLSCWGLPFTSLSAGFWVWNPEVFPAQHRQGAEIGEKEPWQKVKQALHDVSFAWQGRWEISWAPWWRWRPRGSSRCGLLTAGDRSHRFGLEYILLTLLVFLMIQNEILWRLSSLIKYKRKAGKAGYLKILVYWPFKQRLCFFRLLPPNWKEGVAFRLFVSPMVWGSLWNWYLRWKDVGVLLGGFDWAGNWVD